MANLASGWKWHSIKKDLEGIERSSWHPFDFLAGGRLVRAFSKNSFRKTVIYDSSGGV
jgi:hypothetical protein